MKDVMIDIETLGTKPGCVVLSIGAVKFGGGVLGDEFYCEISAKDCQSHGLSIDADTIKWWFSQSIKPPLNGGPLRRGLDDLRNFLYVDLLEGPAPTLWANSPSFDAMILEAAYNAIGEASPWSFRQWRDFRTAKEVLAPDFDSTSVPSFGDHHNALSDAKWQATALMMMGYSAKEN